MKILILTHEQRSHFSKEPGYFEVMMPLARCVENCQIFAYPYQRMTRKNLSEEEKNKALNFLWSDIESICFLWKPDLILNLLTWHTECVPWQILQRIRESICANLVTIFFDHDETSELMLETERNIFESSRLNIFADSPCRVKRIRQGVGVYGNWNNRERALFSPFPIDRTLFKRSPAVIDRVGLMGSLEGRRMNVYKELVFRDKEVYIGGSLLEPSRFMEIDDYAREMGRNLINIVSSTQPYRSQVKGRSFQVIATGTCLLEELNDDNQEILDRDYVWFWSDFDELEAHIDGVLSKPKESLDRARQYSLAMEKHTCPKEWLKRIQKSSSDFSKNSF